MLRVLTVPFGGCFPVTHYLESNFEDGTVTNPVFLLVLQIGALNVAGATP